MNASSNLLTPSRFIAPLPPKLVVKLLIRIFTDQKTTSMLIPQKFNNKKIENSETEQEKKKKERSAFISTQRERE